MIRMAYIYTTLQDVTRSRRPDAAGVLHRTRRGSPRTPRRSRPGRCRTRSRTLPASPPRTGAARSTGCTSRSHSTRRAHRAPGERTCPRVSPMLRRALSATRSPAHAGCSRHRRGPRTTRPARVLRGVLGWTRSAASGPPEVGHPLLPPATAHTGRAREWRTFLQPGWGEDTPALGLPGLLQEMGVLVGEGPCDRPRCRCRRAEHDSPCGSSSKGSEARILDH